MANNYDKILELANANNMGLSNTIKRDFGIPLDYTSVQKDYLEAVKYAATNTLAYIGQPISVGDKLYIVTADAQGKYPAEVGDGETQYDVYLAEVGSATAGDEKTIDLKDGVLTLHGIDGKLTGTYVPSLVDGVLTWNAPDNTTVDGLTASVDALNLKVFGKEADTEAGTEAVEGLVDTVAANTQAIADNAADIADNAAAIENITKAETGAIATAVAAEASARDTAIDTAFTTKVGTITEGKTVVGMISDVEAKIPTNNNQLTNGAGYQTASDVSTAISNKADKATTLAGYGITDAYTKEEVNNAIAGITHFTTKVVTTVDEVTESGVLYLIKSKDVAGKDNYDEYLYIEGLGATLIGDTSTDLSDYVTNSALTTALAPYAKTADVVAKSDFETFKGENTQAISDARTNAVADVAAVGYALETSVASRLSGKVDTATLDNYYTKDAADGKFAVAATVSEQLASKADKETTYTKTEVNEIQAALNTAVGLKADQATTYTKDEINELLADIEGGSTESAASVSRALDAYKTSNDARVDTLESKVGSAKAGEVAATGLFAKVDAAQAKADEAAAAVSTLENGQVKTNKENIAAVLTRVENVETQASTNKTDISTLNGTVNGLNTTVSGHTTKITEIEAQLVTLGNKDTELDTAIKANATEIGKKANAADVYTKTDIDGKILTTGTVEHTADGKSEGITISGTTISVVVDSYTKAEVDDKLANLDQSALEAGIANNAADIEVLVGDDKSAETGRAAKSVRAIAAEEVAKIVDGAPEALDTLAEIAAWITDDNTGSAAVVEDIAKHTAILAGIGGEDQPATVVAAIETAKNEAIAAIPALEVATADTLGGVKSATGDNKVTVAADGVMSVSSINVNTLTQTAGDVLILNGGTAAD